MNNIIRNIREALEEPKTELRNAYVEVQLALLARELQQPNTNKYKAADLLPNNSTKYRGVF